MSSQLNSRPPGRPPLAAVAALRAQLWDCGFRPVPIYSADSRATASPGKAPKGDNWTERARLDPPAAVVSAPDPDALNTGILCDGLRAIDIDVDNPTLAASVRSAALQRFGECPMRLRGNSARCLLLYRAAEGEPRKRSIAGTFGKVEILGRGQQFVAFGKHPSGSDLSWMPEHPAEISADTLPAITEQEITAFLVEAATTIGAQPEHVATDRTAPQSSGRGLRGDTLQVVAALSAIPNDGPTDWEHWNRIGMATWAATGGGEAGRAAFHAWSETNAAYDAQETDRRWDHYRTSPPTQIGAGTLFHLARASKPPGGEDGPPSEQDPAFWESLTRSLEAGPEEIPPQDDDAEVAEVSAEVARKSAIIDPRNWTAPAPLREWVVDGWIPRGYVTGLYGDGAMGKSLVAQHLMTCVSLSLPWFGLKTAGGRSFGMMCEDDEDELHRRQEGVNRSLRVGMENLENLRYISRVGADNILMTFDERNRGYPTDLLGQVCRFLEKYHPTLVVLDTLADIFGGDEIKRVHARQFIQGVGGNIARQFNCAVVIPAHPSRAGLATGKGDGGSTAWNNTFRSRLYLTQPEGEGKENYRTLSRMKANYSSKEGELSLVWQDGCFVPNVQSPPQQPQVSWPEIDIIFNEIDRAWQANEPWSNAPQTRRDGRYLPAWAEMQLGLQASVVAKYIDGWLVTGHLKVAFLDHRTKQKGLRVVRRIVPEASHDDED